MFYHKCYKLNLLLVSDILEGVSTQGHFGLSAISARGYYGQARFLAVNQKVRLTLTVLRPRGRTECACLPDLTSYSSGFNELRLLRIFIFDVSISLFSFFWIGKIFYGHIYGVLMALDPGAHFCSSLIVSMTLDQSVLPFLLKQLPFPFSICVTAPHKAQVRDS